MRSERSGAFGAPRASEPGGVQGPPPERLDADYLFRQFLDEMEKR
jgi:hypothetical protein